MSRVAGVSTRWLWAICATLLLATAIAVCRVQLTVTRLPYYSFTVALSWRLPNQRVGRVWHIQFATADVIFTD